MVYMSNGPVKTANYQTCICGKECKGRAALANHGKKCPTERARSRAFVAADHALTDAEFLKSIVTAQEAAEYASDRGVSVSWNVYRSIAAVKCAIAQAAQSCTMRASRNCLGDDEVTVKARMTNVATGVSIERNLCPPCRELVQDGDSYAGYTELSTN
jgi:hypothetical protein